MFQKIVCGLLLVSLFLLPSLIDYKPVIDPYQSLYDSRIHQLVAFCVAHPKIYKNLKNCYAKEYVQAADQSGYDYKVLPVIAILESSGCVYLRYNNCFGWNSAKTGFGTISEGISFVTGQLAGGRAYRGKTLEQKIKTYNSENPSYYSEFLFYYKQL